MSADVSPANIVFQLEDIKDYTRDDIYRLFGPPEKHPLKTKSGEGPGPEAPAYTVKALDWLSSECDIITNNVSLANFNQVFLSTSPPERILATPIQYLAPEVAVGLCASPASDVWALGCSIIKIRFGQDIFRRHDVTSPRDLTKAIGQYLGKMPGPWPYSLFDSDGYPTHDTDKGKPTEGAEKIRSIKDFVYGIWDQPVATDEMLLFELEDIIDYDENTRPYPAHLSDKFYKPSAIKVGGAYLGKLDEETKKLTDTLPKISENEAAQLYDLLSKIFVYRPRDRPTAKELLAHPWFHIKEE